MSDLRYARWNADANPGPTFAVLEWVDQNDLPVTIDAPVTIYLGGDESAPTVFTGATPFSGVTLGNISTVEVEIPSEDTLFRLALGGVLLTIGELHVVLDGSPAPTLTQTIRTTSGSIKVRGYYAGSSGAMTITDDGYVMFVVPSPDGTITFDGDGDVVFTIP